MEIISQRGTSQRTDGGFIYRFDKSLKDGSEAWRCTKSGCKGRVRVVNGEVHLKSDHNHVPNPTEVAVKHYLSSIRNRASSSQDTPKIVLEQELSLLTEDSIAQLPKYEALRRMIERTRKSRSGGAKKKSSKSGGGATSTANGGGLLVHVVPQKPKQKGKKAKKASQPQALDADGFIVQDADDDYVERKFREDLREALKNSRESVSSSPPQQLPPSCAQASERPPDKKAGIVVARDPIEDSIDDLDKQAEALINKANGAEKLRETQLMSFYRKRLLDTIRELNAKTEALTKANTDVEKYRSRYKKICELLRDAEVNEKAHMAAELDKAHRVEAEMGTQIGTLQGELMQAKSKIHELEVKLRELQDIRR